MDDRAHQLSRSWEANAAAWTEVVRGAQIESRRVVTDAAIIDAVTALEPAGVLDVGCGEGWLTRSLQARGIRAVGVDGAARLIENARAAGPGEYHHLRYEDFDDLATAAGRGFDAAVCNFSLLNEKIQPVLSALRGVIAPGGRLVIQTVHPWAVSADAAYEDGWRTESFASLATPFPEPMPWYFRTLASWSSELRTAGFLLDLLREPRHPGNGQLLSLILTGINPHS